jgi:hypothetical protein
MRRSLFDNYAPQLHKPPRLRPNAYARIAQFSFKHAYMVLLFWLAFAAALNFYAFQQAPRSQIPFDFSGNLTAQKYQNLLQKNFPSLETMITINVSNADAERLKRARQTLVSALETDTENFEIVYAPGTGAYYDTHAILYHSLEDVQARVAYAKSLKPLFDAIAEAPTTASLATLVNEVRGSIEQGRDPQGLDELFSESAKSVQALMLGTERPVDWNFVASLNAENVSTNALIFAVPKNGMNEKAAIALKAVVATLPQDDGTTTLIDSAEQQKIEFASPAPQNLLTAGLAMAAVLIGFSLIAFIGDFTLASMIVLPTLLTSAIAYGLARIVIPTQFEEFWPLILGCGLFSVLLGGRLAFALVETHNIARSQESSVMLASQKHGLTIVWMSLVAAALTLCLLATTDLNYLLPAGCIVAALLISSLINISLGSSIASFQTEPSQWYAKEWLLPISNALFKNNFAQMLLKSAAVAALVCAALGLWFAPTLFTSFDKIKPAQSTVNILASSNDEAERIVTKLKSIPEAQGVRWLGAFLPQQVEGKQKILGELKDQFPHVTPLVPQDVDILREQIATLQDSLKDISNAPATRPALKLAASEFRQSLGLLSATSENKEVLAFENRIFGSFNVLADRSQAFADMDKPNFNSFDERLRSLFLSADGTFRLEVTPLAGVTNEDLARKLNLERFHVAHPILAVDGVELARLQAYEYVLGAAALLSILAVLLFTRSALETFVFAFAVLSLVGIELAYFKLLGSEADLRNLLIALVALIFVTMAHIAHHAQPSRHEKSVETLLPIIILACACLPFALLKLNALLNNVGQIAMLMFIGLIVLMAFEALGIRQIKNRRFALPPHSMP